MTDSKANALLNSERLLFTTEFRAIWLVAIVGLSLSIAALWLIRQQLESHKQLEFEWVAHNRIRAIDHGIQGSLLAVTNIHDFYSASGDVQPDEFQQLAKAQLRRNEGIKLLMWLSRTNVLGERTNPETAALLHQDLQLTIQPNEDQTYHIAHVAAHQHTELELIPDKALVELLEQAYDTGELAVSGPIALTAETENIDFGFMAGLPVYPANQTLKETDQQKPQPAGFVLGLFKLNELVNNSVALLEPRGVEILLLDHTTPSGRQFLHFYSSRLALKDVDRNNYLAWLKYDEPKVEESFRVANRTWRIICGQLDDFRSAEAFQKSPIVAMIIGLIFTSLISFYLMRFKENTAERIAMQQHLMEREELFRQMTETVDEVFWATTADMKTLLYLSPAYEAIFGVSSGLQEQQSLVNLAAIPQADRTSLLNALEKVRNTSTVQELIHRVYWEDGTMRWVRTRGFPVNDEQGTVYRIVGFIEDITEKKLADEAIRESEAKLRNMFQQSPDIIMTIDKRGKILLMNRSTPELPAERALGHNSLALMPYGFRKWFRRALRKVFRKGVTKQFEYSADDNTVWEGRIVPIRADGPVTAAMVIASDVTEKRTLEHQAQRNARLASIGVLSAGVAHEINNPNNAIQLNAGLISRAWDDITPILTTYFEEQGDFSLGGLAYSEAHETLPMLLSEIGRNSERIRRIVENLKHMARQDTGKLTENVDIQQVLESTLMMLHNQIQKHTDVCNLAVPDDLPRVKGNSQQLEQVFINILMNALQSLPDRRHGVFVSAAFNPETENLEIKIRDEGCGISQHDLGRLTEPFFTTRTDAGGTGLGLSITRSIIERHHGSLAFESELGKGTIMTIRIPAAAPK